MQRPVGIAQKLARQQDHVGFSLCNDCIGLRRVSDESDCRRGNSGFAPNLLGKRNLKAGRNRNLGGRHKTSSGDVNQVDAMLAQQSGKAHRLLCRPAAFHPVSGGDAHEYRQMLRPGSTHCIDHQQREVHAVLKAAAELIRALVGERRQKLMQQIAVRRVYLDKVEARALGTARGCGKTAHHRGDTRLGQRLRHGVLRRKRDGTGRNRLPAAFVRAEQPLARKWH